MKIAYVCADGGIPLCGNKGASVHLRSIALALSRRGHEITLACQNLEGDNPRPAGVRIERLPLAAEQHEGRLRLLFGDLKIDVVLERYSLASGPAHRAALALGIPIVLEVNAPLVDEAARYRGLSDVSTWRVWERGVFSTADRVIAVSNAIKNHVAALGVDPRRIALIHNGVDLASFEGADGRAVRSRHGLHDAFVVGFAGSLKAWHGVELLVQALDMLPATVRLLIVGEGPQRAPLAKLVAERGLAERISFAGAVAHDQIPMHLAAMDVGAAPYLAQEGFYFSPLKVIEYMAAGLPVLASDQGDLASLVEGAGILVPAGDVHALAAAIRHLAADGVLRARLSEAGRAQARKRDWSTVAERVESVLASPKVAV